MRHRRKGAVLGRAPAHQRALLRNLASALFLTERDAELDDNRPKVAGRIITTLAKAKAVRPVVEKCVTLARRVNAAEDVARPLGTVAKRGTPEWKTWRESKQYRDWNAAMAPAVAGRRRLVRLLGDKQAVRVLCSVVAPRFVGRPGGYTRILKLAKPRLGDAGPRAALEFVGRNDRAIRKAAAPKIEG